MSDLYHDKYRIPSTRLRGWDYSSSAYYFVTICTHNRICYFGDVLRDNNGEYSVALSPIGKIARDCWLDIPKHFPFVILDAWIIMPNHVHGILQIDKSKFRGFGRDEAMPRLYTGPYPQMSIISPKPQSLPVIIGSFKSIVAKTTHRLYPDIDFRWQTRFYDRIIRNETALYAVRHYTKTNPDNWHRDRNNLDGLLM